MGQRNKLHIVITVMNIIVIVFCISMTLLMLFPIAFNHFSNQDKLIFGHYLYVNTNSNLSPVMKENDIVIVKPQSITQMQVGDYLCYYRTNVPNSNAQFGKIMAVEDNSIHLSDELGHDVLFSGDEITIIGKATNTVLFLGKIVHFFQSEANRLLFYVSVGAVTLFLIGIILLLHLSLRRKNKLVTSAPPKQLYSLNELIQLEENVEFEKAEKKEEILQK